jgi:2-dehydropantoate 2-reductase
MIIGSNPRIAIAGSGRVGCYVGGCLALAGRDVIFLTRERHEATLKQHGMRISDLDGFDQTLPTPMLTTDPHQAFANADVILVAVKSDDTDDIARAIAAHAPETSVTLSLQNGLNNVPCLRSHLGATRQVLAGMVPFNVINKADRTSPRPHFHRATSGNILIQSGCAGLRQCLDVPGARVEEHGDIVGVQWGKLVVNLNNAVNALAGVPLADELSDRRWRLLLARQMNEALAVLKSHGIHPRAVGTIHPRIMALALRLPDPLFKLAAGRMLGVDPEARSSMWDDLEAHRNTEIDHLQGTILALAAKSGQATPCIKGVVELVKKAERAREGSPKLSPEAVAAATR